MTSNINSKLMSNIDPNTLKEFNKLGWEQIAGNESFFGSIIDFIKSMCFLTDGGKKFLMNLQKVIIELTKNSSITISGISTVLIYLLAFVLIYRLTCLTFFPEPHKVFFKYNIFTVFYFANWVVSATLAFKYLNIPNIYASITFRNLFLHSKILICAIAISISVFVILSFIVLYLPNFMILVLFVMLFVATSAGMYLKIEPTVFNLTCISIPLLSVIITVTLLTRNLKSYIERLKRCFALLYSNLMPLLAFFLVSSTLHFIEIYFLKLIWKNHIHNTASYFYLVFLFAWAYFAASYTNNVFISALLSLSYSKKSNSKLIFDFSIFKIAIYRCFEAFNYICYCSMLPAIFQTFISVLDSIYDSTKSSKLSLIRMGSYLIYIFVWILEIASFLIDFKNVSAFTDIGINGIEKYIAVVDQAHDSGEDFTNLQDDFISPNPVSFSQIVSQDRLLYYSWDFLPYITLSIASFLNYKFLLTNLDLTLYYMFVSYSILTSLISTVLIAYQVISSIQKADFIISLEAKVSADQVIYPELNINTQN